MTKHLFRMAEEVRSLRGFYYDSRRRRYFRVRPGYNDFNPLTWDSIEKEKMQEKRELIHQSGSLIREGYKGIPGLLRRRETGPIACCWNWQRKVTNNRAIAMQPQTVLQPRSRCPNPPSQMQLDASNTRLFIAGQPKPSCYCLDCFEVVVSANNINLKLVNNTSHETCWPDYMYMALRPHSCEPSAPVGIVISASGQLVLFNRDRQETRFTQHASRGVIRCSWQRNAMRSVEVAITRNAKKPISICNIETLEIAILPVVVQSPSEILCLEFMTRSPVLLTGCRNGAISAVDLRMRHRTTPGLLFNMEKSAGDIKAMEDENYILAMSLNGQFGMFDMRLAKCVHQYQQHMGTHRQMSFCMNSQESLVFAPGEDRIVRIWDINQQQPIQQFVPELIQGHELVEGQGQPPIVAYGDNIGGRSAGLFTSIDTSVYFYSL